MISLLGQVKEIVLRSINGAHDQEVNMEARRLLGSEKFSEDLLLVMFHHPAPPSSLLYIHASCLPMKHAVRACGRASTDSL